MRKYAYFFYGVMCHLLFLVTFAYMIGFFGDFLVPKSIDTPGEGSVAVALAMNLLMVVLFAAQHSVMARPAFKRIWTRIVPTPIERSTYVLLSCVVVIVLMWQWRAVTTVVWDFQHPILRGVMWALFVMGWLLIPAVSLLIDHFDLFGTRQVWLYLRGRKYTSLAFRVPLLYKYVRHPLYIGWTIAFWATPTMTVGHLLLALGLTGYMALAARVEERDLVDHFGSQYEEYKRRVPMFIPRLTAAAPTSLAMDETQAVEQSCDLDHCTKKFEHAEVD
jgi:protein-S-isoprenylcysteine O-methyltransferase Ste14